VIGKTGRAYFRKINAEGGINGRKINFVSYDDAYRRRRRWSRRASWSRATIVLIVFIRWAPHRIQRSKNT
jgi:branched-chain amino acid transport system substrate-binding protein